MERRRSRDEVSEGTSSVPELVWASEARLVLDEMMQGMGSQLSCFMHILPPWLGNRHEVGGDLGHHRPLVLVLVRCALDEMPGKDLYCLATAWEMYTAFPLLSLNSKILPPT
jgi:hypothetical protein